MNCMFSGEPADTQEHVIPKWMQSRFNLHNQTVCIPNGTTLPYRQVKVPVAGKHNSKFGQIEDRISRGIFIPQEVYLWALKIHVGFLFRDASLKMDRTIPDSETIWNLDDFGQEIAMFRTLYGIWADGGTISPDPFGSVFVVDALTPQPEFDFIHCVWSGTVVIQLGSKLIFVALWDQADGLHANFLDLWELHHKKFVQSAPEGERQLYGYSAHHVWTCESAYWLWRQRRPFTFIKTKRSFALVPPFARRDGRPCSEPELARFCQTFGLRLVQYNGETSNVFTLRDSLISGTAA